MNKTKMEEFRKKYLSGICPICDKIYIYRIALANHLVKKHKKEFEEFTQALLTY